MLLSCLIADSSCCYGSVILSHCFKAMPLGFFIIILSLCYYIGVLLYWCFAILLCRCCWLNFFMEWEDHPKMVSVDLQALLRFWCHPLWLNDFDFNGICPKSLESLEVQLWCIVPLKSCYALTLPFYYVMLLCQYGWLNFSLSERSIQRWLV